VVTFHRLRQPVLNVFLDPAAPVFYRDWNSAALSSVAGFRMATGTAPDNPRVRELLDHLRRTSPEFERMWQRGDARSKAAEVKTLVHPDVGEVTLRVQTFDVRSSPGQQLVIYHAEPSTASADALTLLGSLATPTARR